MNTTEFILKEEFIPLIQLLKFTGIAESGAQASELVESGLVYCNEQIETRKRYKVRKGDKVQVESNTILVV
ncbi:MAG: RNA-binding S4 domain-containing protein [Bacteroidetes bacterium]|nr:RNA-binding S4 domain-containing protein [Bacteroidota bacterium]